MAEQPAEKPAVHRFVNNHTPNYRVIHPALGELRFVRGSLDTSEEGAAFIRSLPIFGRLIFEGDDTAPAHGTLMASPPAPKANPFDRAAYCSICDQVFSSSGHYQRHMKKTHGEEEESK